MLRNRLRLVSSAPSLDQQTAAAIEADFSVAEPESFLALCVRKNDENLDKLRGAEMRLQAEIAELSEQLRQTRVVIKAREAQGAILAAGQHQQAAE